MSTRILREQGPHYPGHSPLGNRIYARAHLRSPNQFRYLCSGLSAQCGDGSVRVCQASYEDVLNIQVVSILEKYHRGINLFCKLFSSNGDPARVFQRAEQ